MNPKDIKIGDYLLVNSEPNSWSSYFNSNNIKDIKVFPYLAKIIDKSVHSNHALIKVNNIKDTYFGADLEALCYVSEKFNPIGYYVHILRDSYDLTVGHNYKVCDLSTIGEDSYIQIENDRGYYVTFACEKEGKYFIYSLNGYNKEEEIIEEKKEIVTTKNVPIYDDRVPLPKRKHIPKPLTPLQQQIVNILLYHPEQYRSFLGKVDNPGYVVHFVKKLLPSRVGYEFDTTDFNRIPEELDGIIAKTVKDKKVKKSKNTIMEYNRDAVCSKDSNTEIRFSFNHITGFKRLKLLLHQMGKHGIKPASNGGLHIHINTLPVMDTTWGYVASPNRKELLKRLKVIRSYRPYIYNVFGITKQTERYRDITIAHKFISIGDRAKIAVLKQKDTLEWRLANTTFDYTQIMKWTIFCHLMTQLVKYPNNKFNMDLFENIRYS